jgi:hypothetical protein
MKQVLYREHTNIRCPWYKIYLPGQPRAWSLCVCDLNDVFSVRLYDEHTIVISTCIVFKFYVHFRSWSDRRRFTKQKKHLRLQRPTLPEGTKLIKFPLPVQNPGRILWI